MGSLRTLPGISSVLCSICLSSITYETSGLPVAKTLIFYIKKIMVAMVIHKTSTLLQRPVQLNQALFDYNDISFHDINLFSSE